MPARAILYAGRSSIRSPARRISPPFGGAIPAIALKVVLLPAPFRPIRAHDLAPADRKAQIEKDLARAIEDVDPVDPQQRRLAHSARSSGGAEWSVPR